MIPHEYIEELTRRTDIVELVGSYVQLKRKGRLYGGPVPLPQRKNALLSTSILTRRAFIALDVRPAGDAIGFVKKINNIEYRGSHQDAGGPGRDAGAPGGRQDRAGCAAASCP